MKNPAKFFRKAEFQARPRADSRHRGNARRLGLPTLGAGRVPAALAHGPGMDGTKSQCAVELRAECIFSNSTLDLPGNGARSHQTWRFGPWESIQLDGFCCKKWRDVEEGLLALGISR